jgi:SAM-dependent methyltransferase
MPKSKNKKKKPLRDKFVLYQESVQNADFEVGLFKRIYKKFRGKPPRRFREDFCGTALLACEWVRRIKNGVAQGVDIDAPTLAWGRKHNVAALGDRADRVELVNCDVLEARGFEPDVVGAVNFSYFVFKTRKGLLDYFRSVHESLAEDGVFIMDLYGGPEAQIRQEEKTKYGGFTYIWDQDRFNPITGEALCHIHFRLADGTKLKKAFTYDWRLWTIPELRDILADAGFPESVVYWEGTDNKTGEGNGVYRISEKGDSAQSWVAYIAAAK